VSGNSTRVVAVGDAAILYTDLPYAASEPLLSVDDVTVSEGGTATFTISLSASPAAPVTVQWATADGTAVAGSDYTTASGTVSFAISETTKTIPITTIADLVNGEATETFYVNLGNAVGAAITDHQGLATITNVDVLPTLSISDASVSEGNSGTKVLTFTVTLSAASASTVTANWATSDGTATAGTDYVAGSNGLTFNAGETSKPIDVTINGDTDYEGDETLTVTLSSPSGATILDGSGTGTITNDDTPPLPSLSISDASVSEGNSGTKVLTFTVTLSAASASTVTASWATSDGTATAGTDYVAGSNGLTFNAGETSKPIDVTINGDTDYEGDETFTVTLSNPSGATIAVGSGTGTITNDDAAPILPEPVGGRTL